MKKVCMIVQDKMVKGGIAAVISGYYGSELEKKYDITYVESYKNGSKFQKIFKGIKGYFDFLKIVLFNKPDLVHVHSSFGMSFYRKLPFIFIASFFKIPIINHIHGAEFNSFYTNASKKKQMLIKHTYRRCAALVALSEEWKEKLSQIVPLDKITIIENYSILHRDALIERLERTTNNTVLFLGELGKRKGCYDIPEIVSDVVREIPDVKFIMAGTGAATDENNIKKRIMEKCVSDNLVFPGWIRGSEKDKILRYADVFLLPSYNEGMPMSILDAMGYGLPVVSTNVGGIPKIVENGRNGYTLFPGDVAGISKAIIGILTDERVRKQYGKESFNIVQDKYSLESHLKKLMDLYEREIL